MPLRARLVVIGWVCAYLALSASLVRAAYACAPAWVSVAIAAMLLAITAVILDALHPRVSLFMASINRVPQDVGGSTIALSFDDGPVQPYTAQILEILDRYGVKASFFCIGDNVCRNPDLAKEILRRGHTLGNHTQTHRTLSLADAATVAGEVDAAQANIRHNCEVEPTYFRCPKGYKSAIVARVLRRRRLRLVGYSYPIWDVQNPPPAELVKRVLDRARPGDIIVMHDGYPGNKPGRRDHLVAALPRIVEGLLDKGLRPVSLDQALSP